MGKGKKGRGRQEEEENDGGAYEDITFPDGLGDLFGEEVGNQEHGNDQRNRGRKRERGARAEPPAHHHDKRSSRQQPQQPQHGHPWANHHDDAHGHGPHQGGWGDNDHGNWANGGWGDANGGGWGEPSGGWGEPSGGGWGDNNGGRRDHVDGWEQNTGREEKRPNNKKEKQQKKKKGGRQDTKGQGWNEQPGDGWGHQSGWEENAPYNWDEGDAWNNHHQGDWQNGWGQDDNWGDRKDKKKDKSNKNRGNFFGVWGNGVDQEKMEAYHQDLLRRLAHAAPPPRGPEFGPLPSRTLSMARQDGDKILMVADTPANGDALIRFVDSGGAALEPAANALFGRNRLAQDRFHWLFSPSKDMRVAQMLTWIQSMSFGLASLGVQKFLETGERGALITNIEYRSKKAPHEPAFDWLSWPAANATFDRTLQQSLAYYDPETQVVVLVFLLSQSQNSMAIWRRKITIPTSIRLSQGENIRLRKEEIAQRKMVIRIDDVQKGALKASFQPPPNPPEPPKKKWFRWAV